MNYLNRLLVIVFILYRNSTYEDKLLLTLLSLDLLNKQRKNTSPNLKTYKNNTHKTKDFKTGYIEKNNIKRPNYNTDKRIFVKRVRNNQKTKLNSSLEKAMALYKEKYNRKILRKNHKDKTILVSTLKQNMKNNYVITENNIINENNNGENKKIIKVPILILSLNILESFKGKIYFSKPIKLIDNITNKIIIKDKVSIIGLNNDLTIFIEGYLETCIDCVEITNNKFYSYVINTPFSSIKHINQIHHKINNKADCNKLIIEIVNSKQEINKQLKKSHENYGYDQCNLLINIDFSVNIFKNDLITI